MARIRSIHPDALKSRKLSAATATAERMYWRLSTHCDDAGRCEDDPVMLAAVLFPMREDIRGGDVAGWLDELERLRLVQRYTSDGDGFLCVTRWSDYQKPQHPKPSTLPEPPPLAAKPTTESSQEDDGTPHEPSPDRARGVGDGEGDGAGGGARPDLLSEACSVLAERHLLRNPSTGNADRHRTAIIRGKVGDYRSRAEAWIEQNPNGTADELAEHLEPTRTAHRPNPFDATAAAAQAMYDRTQARRDGKACERCDGSGVVEHEDGSCSQCDHLSLRSAS